MTTVQPRTQVCGDHAVVVLGEELDITDAESTADPVAMAAVDGLIKLEALDFMACHAGGEPLRMRKTACQAGREVALPAPHEQVPRVLTVLGVAAAADSARRRACYIARYGWTTLAGIWPQAPSGPAAPGPCATSWPWSPRRVGVCRSPTCALWPSGACR